MIEVYTKSVDGVWFGVACKDEQIFATTFAGEKQTVLSNLLSVLPINVAFEVAFKDSNFAEKAIMLVKAAYDGTSLSNIPLAYTYLPSYTAKVLKTVFQIPYGYVSSYGMVAKTVGGSARAVGNVMAANPFVPIIPCHRVVTSNFRLGGYGGGLKVKFEFLKRERKGYTRPQIVSIDRQRLQVFPAETVLAKIEHFPSLFTSAPAQYGLHKNGL